MATPRCCRFFFSVALAAGVASSSWAEAPATLALEVHADVDADGTVGLHAALRSVSGERVAFWLADPYDGGESVSFRLLGEDGASWQPWTPSAPRSPVAEPEGSVEPLVGARERGVSRRTRLFLREYATDQRPVAVPDRLPPGRYAVQCHYTHPTAAVPVRGADGSRTWSPVAQLFSGTVRASPATLVIPALAPVHVAAELQPAPDAGRWPLDIRVRNLSSSNLRLSDHVLVAADGAPGDVVYAHAVLGVSASGAAEATAEIPPGGTVLVTLDVAQLTFETRKHKSRSGSLGQLVSPALVRLEVQLEIESSSLRGVSKGLWRLVDARGDPAHDGR